MTIEFRQAALEDAELLIDIYNASFYSDHLKYGSCPGYGKTKEMMEKSIGEYPKWIVLCDNEPIGCVSRKKLEKGTFEIGCLCVVPEFQGKGIGTHALEFVKTQCEDWERITLVTPMDKRENLKFYTEKCGFRMVSTEKDSKVELARFALER